jgi:hypothetical protein
MSRPQISLPYSWSMNGRPSDVYPGSASRGRYLVRVHREELKLAGALARVGRDLTILGKHYGR